MSILSVFPLMVRVLTRMLTVISRFKLRKLTNDLVRHGAPHRWTDLSEKHENGVITRRILKEVETLRSLRELYGLCIALGLCHEEIGHFLLLEIHSSFHGTFHYGILQDSQFVISS